MKNIAVLGARGLIGAELIKILKQRSYPADKVFLYTSDENYVEKKDIGGIPIEWTTDYKSCIGKVDVVFCCLDKVRARAIVPKFKKKALVIDCSGAFSFDPNALHVIPEINAHMVKMRKGIIANPNHMTILLLISIHSLHKEYGLKRLHVTACAPISGFGEDALDELRYEYEYLAMGLPSEKSDDSIFPYNIAGNLIPQVGDFTQEGYTEEETVMADEVRTILESDDIAISSTCMWVPVSRGTCMAVQVGFEKEISTVEAKETLADAQGLKVLARDDEYPMPENVLDQDEVFVGRLRQDQAFENGLAMWVAADNLRKGSALNAVQIAELPQ
jgi:aspartate-semialdehyde dehydrogenase